MDDRQCKVRKAKSVGAVQGESAVSEYIHQAQIGGVGWSGRTTLCSPLAQVNSVGLKVELNASQLVVLNNGH